MAIVAALFVLPLRAWQRQRTDLAAAKRELAAYERAIDELDAENARLVTAEGVREAARQDYGYKGGSEQVVGILPPGPASDIMPPGWPYSLVRDILAVRRDAVATAAAAAARTTVASTPPIASDPATVDSAAAGPEPGPDSSVAAVSSAAPAASSWRVPNSAASATTACERRSKSCRPRSGPRG